MSRMPRRLKFAQRLKFIPEGIWLDVGAGNGEYLQFMPENSLGVDIVENELKSVYKWNFLDDLPPQFHSKFNVVWCSNFLEHVLDPHRFLIRLRKVLNKKDNSIILVACPNSILLQKGPWRGTLAQDHVNFFTLRTLKLTIEFAGYEVLFAGSPTFPSLPVSISSLLGTFGPTIFIAARPIKDFQYGPGACKVLNDVEEIVFKEIINQEG